jgi:alpha-D-ribose 1-methylphosphonate 5-triphosphate synthase subunit PhnG
MAPGYLSAREADVDRRRRTAILVEGDPALAAELAGRIRERAVVTVLQEPSECLIMLKVRETAKRGLFLMGEVLATEAKAMVEGRIGLGIARGRKPALAADLAVIDAACNAGLPETGEWDSSLEEAEAAISERRAVQDGLIARTAVDFRTMDFPEGQ